MDENKEQESGTPDKYSADTAKKINQLPTILAIAGLFIVILLIGIYIYSNSKNTSLNSAWPLPVP